MSGLFEFFKYFGIYQPIRSKLKPMNELSCQTWSEALSLGPDHLEWWNPEPWLTLSTNLGQQG